MLGALQIPVGGSGDGDFQSNGSVPMGADLDFGSHKGVNVATPTADTDVANKQYVDDNAGGGSGISSRAARSQ